MNSQRSRVANNELFPMGQMYAPICLGAATGISLLLSFEWPWLPYVSLALFLIMPAMLAYEYIRYHLAKRWIRRHFGADAALRAETTARRALIDALTSQQQQRKG